MLQSYYNIFSCEQFYIKNNNTRHVNTVQNVGQIKYKKKKNEYFINKVLVLNISRY